MKKHLIKVLIAFILFLGMVAGSFIFMGGTHCFPGTNWCITLSPYVKLH
jgi:hypothetical protein